LDDTRYTTSSIHKRVLYLNCRNSNDTKLTENYKLYCTIVYKIAKKLYYDKIIVNSKNKMKTTWNVIKSETGKNYA
jgi:hypothetical protein